MSFLLEISIIYSLWKDALCVWIFTFAVAVEGSAHYQREAFFIFFWGSLKDAELRPLVASGWQVSVFDCFDFGHRSYWGSFPPFQNKTKMKEIEEAFTFSLST